MQSMTIRNEFTANDFLANTKQYAMRSARVSYKPTPEAGPVELIVKTAAVVAVIVAIAFLLAGGF